MWRHKPNGKGYQGDNTGARNRATVTIRLTLDVCLEIPYVSEPLVSCHPALAMWVCQSFKHSSAKSQKPVHDASVGW